MSTSASAGLKMLLEKLESRVSLSDADREAFLGLPENIRSVSRHDFIVRDEAAVRDCCVLMSGFAIRHKVAGNGMRQIFSLHMKGDPVDLHNSLLGTADHNLQMISTGQATFIPSEAIRSLTLAFPTIGQALWYETLFEAAIFRDWTLNIGRRNALSRMAHLICELAVRLELAELGGPTQFSLPMTQQELGDALVLTPIHVSRTLKLLAQDGLILRTGRTVKILDWQALVKLGDFDKTYLRQPDNPSLELAK